MDSLEILAEAFGWTLLHSLWMGVAIAAVLALILNIARPQKAQVRYGMAMGALLIMVLGTALVFWQSYDRVHEQRKEEFHLSLVSEAPDIDERWLDESPPVSEEIAEEWFETSVTNEFSDPEFVVEEEGVTLMDFFRDMRPYMPWLTWLWLVGFAFFSLKWIINYLYIQNLRFRHTKPMEFEWQNRLNRMARKIGIRDTLLMLESQKIISPLVLGHFKPVVLFPVGLLTSMTPEQVEAVLAHELSHIIRNDFMVNLIQTIIESIFFYHPAIWWISSQVRVEREHCCDDMAVEILQDKKNYAEALTLVATYSLRKPQLAMGMQGNKKHLLHRIKRLFKPGFEPGRITAKAVFGLLILTSFSGLAFVSPEAAQTVSPRNWAATFDTPVPILPDWMVGMDESFETTEAASEELSHSEEIVELEPMDDHFFEGSLALVDTPPLPPLPPLPPTRSGRIVIPDLPNIQVPAPAVPDVPPPPAPPVAFRYVEGMTEAEIEEQLSEFEGTIEAYEEEVDVWADEYGEQWEAYAEAWEEWGEKFGEKYNKEFGDEFGEEFGEQLAKDLTYKLELDMENFEVNVEAWAEKLEVWAEQWESWAEAIEEQEEGHHNWNRYREAQEAHARQKEASARTQELQARERELEARQRELEARIREMKRRQEEFARAQRQSQPVQADAERIEEALRAKERELREMEIRLREQEVVAEQRRQERQREERVRERVYDENLSREEQIVREAERELDNLTARDCNCAANGERRILVNSNVNSRSFSSKLRRSLRNDGLIGDDARGFSFCIDEQNMHVNGVRVSDRIHERYLQRMEEWGQDIGDGAY
ncbi:MAG: M56 family metallopeptidase [Bacteroidota bacterium]